MAELIDIVFDRPMLARLADEVVHKDGTAYGFPRPTRRYGEALAKAAE